MRLHKDYESCSIIISPGQYMASVKSHTFVKRIWNIQRRHKTNTTKAADLGWETGAMWQGVAHRHYITGMLTFSRSICVKLKLYSVWSQIFFSTWIKHSPHCISGSWFTEGETVLGTKHIHSNPRKSQRLCLACSPDVLRMLWAGSGDNNSVLGVYLAFLPSFSRSLALVWNL